MREVVRGDKHNLRKSANRNAQTVSFTHHILLICALRFADFLRLCLSPRTTSRTISFSSYFQQFLVLIWFLFRYLLSTCCSVPRVVRVCAAFLGPLRGPNSCCLWLWQLGFAVSLRAATSNLLSSPNPLSNRSVLHDGRKHKTVVVLQLPTLSANKHVVQIFRSSLSAAVQTVQVIVQPSPFNGIERSLSRAVVPKT